MPRTTSLDGQEPQMRVQINQIDYTLEPPGELDSAESHSRAPVIRIYGASSFGETACVHVHQVYPYFFVEYLDLLDPDHVKHYTATLARSLNHALALSLKRNPDSPNSQYIRSVILVKGVHFYGFHAQHSPFLKIYFIDPAVTNRAAAIMQSGTIMATRFRTYESHLGFILQFMCDFNLYGCDWINLQKVFLRGVEQFSEDEESRTRYDLAPSPYYCQSRVPLEVDVAAPHILNRHHLERREMQNKLQISPPLISNGPLISSVRELWDDERKRRLARGLDPSPEMPMDPSESKRQPGGGWVAEARLWDELSRRIHRESDNSNSYESPRQEWEEWTMPAFESIEAVWQREYRIWTPLKQQTMGCMEERLPVMTDPIGNDEDVGIQVDVEMLSSQEVVQRLQLEEEGIAEVVNEDVYDEVEDTADHPGEQSHLSHPGSPANPFMTDEPDVNVDEFILPEYVSYAITGNSSRSRRSGLTRTRYNSPNQNQRFDMEMSPLTPPTRKRVLPLSQLDQVAQSQTPSPISSPGTFSDGGNTTRPPKRRRRDTSLFHDFDTISRISGSTINSIKRVTQFVRHHSYAATKSSSLNRYEYGQQPPSTSDLLESLKLYDLPDRIYREPYYSNGSDVPRKARIYADLTYHLKGSKGIAHLEQWRSISSHQAVPSLSPDSGVYLDSAALGGWEYASCPPSIKQTKWWLQTNKKVSSVSPRRLHSQLEGGSLKNIYGLGTSPGTLKNLREDQCMSILSLEVFVPVNDGKTPDPGNDQIAAVFYAFQKSETESTRKGAIIVSSEHLNNNRIRCIPFEEVSSELEALNLLVDIVIELDPDVVTGWEIQRGSWGYVNSRAVLYGFEFLDLISRAPTRRAANDNDQWSSRHASTIKIIGRHVLNAWRIMRSEQSLASYTLENVVFHVLRRRIPHFSQLTLAKWYQSPVSAHSIAILQYFYKRTLMVLEILNEIEFVTKTAEFARVFGVDFFSVISRGSQFKVESFMFRIAKAEDYILLSPSKIDVGKQNAAECMPLIMEPTSAFYSSPLVVLDFQSLYPSVMIAYNYCYSTCLGRVTDFNGKNKLGVVNLSQPHGIVNTLKEHIQIAPNGVMYVKPEVRHGLLKRMLTELLETRVMVKQAMKIAKDNKSLLKVLNARQLGLKYICNVTYGYTGATYSGRMPAVEIADSIVQTGRETLEKAIAIINTTGKWGAQVVYGDTDSIFVYLPGKTREQAFRIGSDIADTITVLNPNPIKLKFEKVYHPCVLLAKKRYVGFKYENPDQTEPTFDAKGIETVRRDGVLAQQKMMENCLKMLFRSQDLSEIKAYCHRSWTKLLDDRVSVRDFIFSKEVKLGTYSEKGPPPPGALVASRRMLSDPNSEPQYGERVPYVIIKGPPGSRLVDRALDPLEFIQNRQQRLDAPFYITRVLIPPLERIFNLVGADVRQWYNEMPKPSQLDPTMSPKKATKAIVDSPSKRNISDHFYSLQCSVCNGPAPDDELCDDCRSSPQEMTTKLGYRMHDDTSRLANSHVVCASCTMTTPGEPIECDSLDCPWFFSRKKAERRIEFTSVIERTYRGSASSMTPPKARESRSPYTIGDEEPTKNIVKNRTSIVP